MPRIPIKPSSEAQLTTQVPSVKMPEDFYGQQFDAQRGVARAIGGAASLFADLAVKYKRMAEDDQFTDIVIANAKSQTQYEDGLPVSVKGFMDAGKEALPNIQDHVRKTTDEQIDLLTKNIKDPVLKSKTTNMLKQSAAEHYIRVSSKVMQIQADITQAKMPEKLKELALLGKSDVGDKLIEEYEKTGLLTPSHATQARELQARLRANGLEDSVLGSASAIRDKDGNIDFVAAQKHIDASGLSNESKLKVKKELNDLGTLESINDDKKWLALSGESEKNWMKLLEAGDYAGLKAAITSFSSGMLGEYARKEVDLKMQWHRIVDAAMKDALKEKTTLTNDVARDNFDTEISKLEMSPGDDKKASEILMKLHLARFETNRLSDEDYRKLKERVQKATDPENPYRKSDFKHGVDVLNELRGSYLFAPDTEIDKKGQITEEGIRLNALKHQSLVNAFEAWYKEKPRSPKEVEEYIGTVTESFKREKAAAWWAKTFNFLTMSPVRLGIEAMMVQKKINKLKAETNTKEPANKPKQSAKITKTAANPKTGKKVGWNGKEWIPLD